MPPVVCFPARPNCPAEPHSIAGQRPESTVPCPVSHQWVFQPRAPHSPQVQAAKSLAHHSRSPTQVTMPPPQSESQSASVPPNP
jgi:hypothetical protein